MSAWDWIALSLPVFIVVLFLCGQALDDYFEVHWAAQSMAPEIDRNYRHVAARTISSNAAGYVVYVVFDPADNDPADVEQTVASMQKVCVEHLRTIGDRFYLVDGAVKPC